MKKKIIPIITICVCALMILPACGNAENGNTKDNFQNPSETPGYNVDTDTDDSTSGSVSTGIDSDTNRPTDANDVAELETDNNVYSYTYTDETSYTDEDGNEIVEYTFINEESDTESLYVQYDKGTTDCFELDKDTNTLTFSGVDDKEMTEYTLSGSFHGNIVVDSQKDGDEYKFTLNLSDLTLTSYDVCPLNFTAGDEIDVSAKSGTENYIYDLRDEVDDDSDDKSASVYAACDLNLKGKGELFVKSTNNKGIHSKDDLDAKNLSFYVDCTDNCLKGNDSVTIESGTYTLIARQGDGIKTENSDVSKKGNQKGTIEIDGGDILIYAACDGIDSSYDVIIGKDGGSDVPEIEIYTDKYSKYSEEVTDVSEGTYYIMCSSTAYKYSVKYFNDDSDVKWVNSSSYSSKITNNRTYYYYPVDKLSGYTKMQVYVYEFSQEQGQDENYFMRSDALTPSTTYDTIHFSTTQRTAFSWENYSTTQVMPGGSMGGTMPSDGNTDKGSYSTKGIKADNQITIYDSVIFVSSYDDAIHANSDNELENGETPEGAVTIYGGEIELYTNDDGVHADGTLTIYDGDITIGGSYEGLEGDNVTVAGGDISVTSSDDGVNGTCTSGVGITVSGGTLYVYAGGDGLDSNSRDSYGGILISGGRSVVISASNSNSSIDNENGYKYEGGYILGIGISGAFNSESTRCREFTSNGTSTTLTLTKENYLVVDGYVTVQMPVSMSKAYVVFLCENSGVKINSATSTNDTLNYNGVSWTV